MVNKGLAVLGILEAGWNQKQNKKHLLLFYFNSRNAVICHSWLWFNIRYIYIFQKFLQIVLKILPFFLFDCTWFFHNYVDAINPFAMGDFYNFFNIFSPFFKNTKHIHWSLIPKGLIKQNHFHLPVSVRILSIFI